MWLRLMTAILALSASVAIEGCASGTSKAPPEVATVVRVEKRAIPDELSSCLTVQAPPEREAPLESDLVNAAIEYQRGYIDCKDTLGRLVNSLKAE